MPRTDVVSTVVYKLSELSPEAQKKAIEKRAQLNSEDFPTFMLTEWFEQELTNHYGYGGCADKIEWSLSSCQGDGVAFYGTLTGEDKHKLVNRLFNGSAHKNDRAILHKVIDAGDLNIEITKNSYGHRYSHYNTMEVEMEYPDTTMRREGLLQAFLEAIKEDVKATSKELQKDGYSDIEEHSSEANAKEQLAEDGVEFYANGTIYNC
jgi:hypothetical protein